MFGALTFLGIMVLTFMLHSTDFYDISNLFCLLGASLCDYQVYFNRRYATLRWILDFVCFWNIVSGQNTNIAKETPNTNNTGHIFLFKKFGKTWPRKILIFDFKYSLICKQLPQIKFYFIFKILKGNEFGDN